MPIITQHQGQTPTAREGAFIGKFPLLRSLHEVENDVLLRRVDFLLSWRELIIVVVQVRRLRHWRFRHDCAADGGNIFSLEAMRRGKRGPREAPIPLVLYSMLSKKWVLQSLQPLDVEERRADARRVRVSQSRGGEPFPLLRAHHRCRARKGIKAAVPAIYPPSAGTMCKSRCTSANFPCISALS